MGSYKLLGIGMIMGIVMGVGLQSLDILEGAKNFLLGQANREVIATITKKEVFLETKEEPKAEVAKPTTTAVTIDLRGANIRVVSEGVSLVDETVKGDNNVKGAEKNSLLCPIRETETPKHGSVFISEVAWMGTADSPTNEWVELKNSGDEVLNLAGWKLQNGDGGVMIDLKGEIKPYGFFLLERKEEAVRGVAADQLFKGAILNEAEGLYLFNEKCELVDEVEAQDEWPAGDSKTRQPMERNWVNLDWQTASIMGGTPGRDSGALKEIIRYESAPTGGSAVISSLTATTTVSGSGGIGLVSVQVGTEAGSSDEWLELENRGSQEIDLTGWTIKKKASSGNESTLVAASRLEGVKVGAGKKILMVNDGGYLGNGAVTVRWPSSYTLAYSNNGLVLYDEEDKKVDEVNWEEIPKGLIYIKENGVWQLK